MKKLLIALLITATAQAQEVTGKFEVGKDVKIGLGLIERFEHISLFAELDLIFHTFRKNGKRHVGIFETEHKKEETLLNLNVGVTLHPQNLKNLTISPFIGVGAGSFNDVHTLREDLYGHSLYIETNNKGHLTFTNVGVRIGYELPLPNPTEIFLNLNKMSHRETNTITIGIKGQF